MSLSQRICTRPEKGLLPRETPGTHVGTASRRVVPENGALLLVEMELSAPNEPSIGKVIDLFMLVLTGGLERTVDEYRDLLARAGFRLNRVVPTNTEFVLIESLPV